MEKKMNAPKTRGAWMVTVKRDIEKKEVPKQSNEQYNHQAVVKLRGGVR